MEEKELVKEENIDSEKVENQSVENSAKPENADSEVNGKESSDHKLLQEIADLKDKYLRLYSEFENFRRRTAKERIDLIKTASEEVIKDIVPVVDDFERAFKASENESDGSIVRDGNHLVFHKLVRMLEFKGLKAMDGLVGKPFDPETQEAITQIPAGSDEMKGKVIDVVEKGYTLGDKVIRYAKVVIGA